MAHRRFPRYGTPMTSASVRAFGQPILLFVSLCRLCAGFFILAIGVAIFVPFLILALPWRPLRIKITNVFGTVVGLSAFWTSGSKVRAVGHDDALARPPAIWAMNHCSFLDIPLGIWFCPLGTCGVGKRQVIYYPFFGLLYVLGGHVRLDRGKSSKAIASLKKMVSFVQGNKLSIFIWPEGTRSPNGRLQEIRKGIVHLALQTGLPIQPMVTMGTHIAWPKGPPLVTPTDINIIFPDPIDTTHWQEETMADHLREIETIFAAHLADDQKPRPMHHA